MMNLKSTYSIWLLGKTAIQNDNHYIHAYKLRDENSKTLTPHGGIWLLELAKFHAKLIATEQAHWLQLFKKYDANFKSSIILGIIFFDDKTTKVS